MKSKWTSPVMFYDLMLTFFALCFGYDIFMDQVNFVSFAWPFCFLYYYHRKQEVKRLLEDSGLHEEEK